MIACISIFPVNDFIQGSKKLLKKIYWNIKADLYRFTVPRRIEIHSLLPLLIDRHVLQKQRAPHAVKCKYMQVSYMLTNARGDISTLNNLYDQTDLSNCLVLQIIWHFSEYLNYWYYQAKGISIKIDFFW